MEKYNNEKSSFNENIDVVFYYNNADTHKSSSEEEEDSDSDNEIDQNIIGNQLKNSVTNTVLHSHSKYE